MMSFNILPRIARYTVVACLATVMACSLFPAKTNAQGIEAGKKYRIESNFDLNNYHRSGALGLGQFHNGGSTTYYVKGGPFTDDCWWFFDRQADGVYRIRNAKTGEYMAHKKRWEDITLVANNEPANRNSIWRVDEEAGCFILFVKSDEDYALHFGNSHKDSEFATTDRGGGAISPFIYFKLYDEEGNQVNPHDVPSYSYAGASVTLPTVKTTLDAYVKDLRMNGRNLSYVSNTKQFLGVLPTGERQLELTFTAVRDGATVTLMSGEQAVTSPSQLSTRKDYQLVVKVGETVKATATLQLTTLPIMEIWHEGSFASGMRDYLLGEVRLSSVEDKETVVLSSRYKSRGATASNYSKRSLNLKLRNRETDAEEDSTLLGMRSASSWILDAMAIDRINMRNRVCFDIWNEYSRLPYETKFDGRNGTVGRYVELLDNGVYRGIYCLTDRINRKLLDLKKPKIDEATGAVTPRGVLYKAGTWDYTGLIESQKNDYMTCYGDTRNGTLWCNWELVAPEDYPSPETWEPLDKLYANASNVSYCYDNFYIDQTRDYHLFIIALSIVDNGNKNEFLAAQNITKIGENKARFVFCPWDLDTSLGGSFDGSNYDGNYTSERIGDLRINLNLPFSALLSHSDYMAAMRTRWLEARDHSLSLYNVTQKMKSYATLFIESGAWQREIACHGDITKGVSGCQVVSDLNKEIELIAQWYANQIEKVDDFLGLPHQPAGIAGVAQTSNDNATTYTLDGRPVASASLRPGIYIQNGRKIVVK